MPDPKGSRLYVNLGPSQTKRRLKGFWHGGRIVACGGDHIRAGATNLNRADDSHTSDVAQPSGAGAKRFGFNVHLA